ncbi:MAG TPA: DUF3309 family protein [Rhabdochlamydiaceae bacterium]|nr:DUF3309 family protein [Rhabdochlamydiaceae bacterium]
MLEIILVIFLVLVVIGMLPKWPYSMNWGYTPMGTILTILLILLLLRLLGVI